MDNRDFSRATLTDIVFENRNKSYGAFMLRKIYDKNILTALAVSIAIFTYLLGVPVLDKIFSPNEEIVVIDDAPKDIVMISVPLDPKTPPPPPIEQLPPPEIKTVKFIPPEPAPDPEVNEPPPPPQEKLNNQNISDQNRKGKDSLADIPNIPIGPIGDLGLGDKDEVYKGAVTKEAGFPGGMQAFMKHMQSHIGQRARTYIQDRGIKGKIYVSFEVTREGEISNVSIPTGRDIPDCKICSEAVLEVIKKMPKWTPAENNGVPVRRLITLPVNIN